ncbi:hypothetical protein [Desulfonatronum thioautotrophicum]|uniref:hypothetical protein n=1 Tax=Desulfonatronum thioautotrophicum TaxID=617001 RepID=UPI00129470ED|nr:hypothetical protein [Desulfonatronum thioautotrophicum]
MNSDDYQARLSRLRERAEARLGRMSADGAELSPDEIISFTLGAAEGSVSDVGT